MSDLRIGVLGAASIVLRGIIRPARAVGGVRISAIAARDPARARSFAARHGIPEVHRSYASLIADPRLDAVYIPLPSAMHGRWTLAALAAGKHVLVEKPFTANADEAEEVAAAASASGLVVMEAFHYRYHPLMHRLVELARSGELGELRHVSARFAIPIPPGKDIRWQLPLGGGTTMDVGCYPIHLVRSVVGGATGQEPEVTDATARAVGGIDRYLRAELRFPSGVTGRITSSIWSAHAVDASATIRGTEGTVRVLGPYHPQAFHAVLVDSSEGRRLERFPRTPTYDFQLEAFRDAVRDGAPVLTGPMDAVANMRVIDAAYLAAGLEPRHPHTGG